MSRAAALCVALLCAASAVRGAVIAGPVTNPANGHAYYLLDFDTWHGAEAQAIALGGHLVTITSAAENVWVWNTFGPGSGPLWIGFTDEAVEGDFVWASGEPAVYTSWWVGGGEPNNLGGIEHYAEVNNGVWNDNTATTPLRAVVELPRGGALEPGDVLTGSGADILRIDAATGSIGSVGTLPADVADVAVDANRRVLAVTDSGLFRVNPGTGAITFLTSFSSPEAPPSVAADPAGGILLNRTTLQGPTLDKLAASGAPVASLSYCSIEVGGPVPSGVVVNGLGKIYAGGGRCRGIYELAFPSSATLVPPLPTGMLWFDVAVESPTSLVGTFLQIFAGFGIGKLPAGTAVPWLGYTLSHDPFRSSQKTIAEYLVSLGGPRHLYAVDADTAAATELGEVGGVDGQGVAVVLPTCADYLDNDGDGAVDFGADAGCSSAADASERAPGQPCDDGLDNDGDFRFDYAPGGAGDPGCRDAAWGTEKPQCNDGLDNDGKPGIDFDGGDSLDIYPRDGLIDANYNPAQPAVGAQDPQCDASWKNREAASGCGLGFELAALLPLLLAQRSGKRRRTGAVRHA